MSHILRTSTEHKTASLADEGNSTYCQSSGAHNIKHIYNLCKLTLRGHLNTDVQAGLELGTLCSRERYLDRSATKLTFQTHVNNLCNKFRQKLNALTRICPLVWMILSRRIDNCINRLHERSLRLTYID